MAEVHSIEIGNLVRKVSLRLFDDLLNLVKIMPAMTAELRAQKLRENTMKFRLKLERLLSICKWLKGPDVKLQLDSIHNEEMVGRKKRQTFEDILSALFHFHANLYPSRVRASEVSIAKEILARGNYPFLPEGMFGIESGGSGNFKEETTRQELDLFIRTKLALDERIPEDCDSAQLINGVLVLRRTNLFQVSFTLAYPDQNAHWKPLNFQLLVSFVNEGLPDKSSHVNVLELKVIDALLKIYLSSIPQGTPKIPLEQQWSMCYYMSMMYSLRMFYVQSLLNSRLFSSVRCESTFNNEDSDKNVLIHRFWESRDPSLFRFELQITITRPISKRESVALFLITGYDSIKHRLQLRDFEDNLCASIKNGDINVLYKKAMKFCGDTMLRVLYCKLMLCDQIIRAIEKGLRVGLSEHCLELGIGGTKFQISIDIRTGQFTLTSTVVGCLGIEIVEIGDKFMNEVNNMFHSKKIWMGWKDLMTPPSDNSLKDMDVVSETSSIFSGNGSSGNEYIVTTESLVRCLVLAYWSNYFQSVLSLAAELDINFDKENDLRKLYFRLKELDTDINSGIECQVVYLSIDMDTSFAPVCYAYICRSKKDALFDRPSVVLSTKLQTFQYEQSWDCLDVDSLWSEILLQTYIWVESVEPTLIGK